LDLKPDQQSLRRLFASDYIPEFVPFQDGRSGEILFLREGTLLAQPFDLRRRELTGEAIPLAERVGNYLGIPLFSSSRTGALVYRSGGTGDFSTLTWFDRQGKMLGNLADAFYGPSTLALSPDGSRAVTERLETTGVNLWLVDLARGGRTRFTYTRSGIDRYAAWSPDGAKIAFTSNRGGHEDLYLHAANGSGEDELLLKFDSDKSVTDWSRDGHFLLFNQLSGKAVRELWVLPLDAAGGQKPIPFLRSDFDSRSGRFSPNGRWVAYGSNESGNYEIYVRPFPPSAGGGKWMVSQGNGANPRWRRDGKELFYLRPDGELMVADVGADGAVFQAGVPRPLFKATFVQGWDVSADGTKFLFPMAGGETTQSPFTVVLNWMSLLK
jgi:WD40 repeat protein